jgi:hypothetical protein
MAVTRTNEYTQLYYFDPALYPLGSKLDETLMTIPPGDPLAGDEVRRTRILLAGDQNYNEIVRVTNDGINGNEYAILTRNVNEAPKNSVIYTDSNSTSSGVVTLANYTVPVGFRFNFMGIICTGDLPGKYSVYHKVGAAETLLFVVRGTASIPNVSQIFQNPLKTVAAGESILVKVENFTNAVTGNYDASIIGFSTDLS